MTRRLVSLVAAWVCLGAGAAQALYVTIGSPRPGQNCVAARGVWVSGTAAGNTSPGQTDGVVRVAVYANSNWIGDAASLQTNAWGGYVWSCSWANPPLGPAALTALAYSQTGNVATSYTAVTVTIVATNTPPVASDIGGSLVEGAVSINLWPSMTDPDAGQALVARIDTGPANGTVAVTNAGGSGGVTGGEGGNYGPQYFFVYAPRSGFIGVDAFTYRVNDGFEDSNVATARVTVVSNTPPTAYALRVSLAPDTNALIAADYTDPDAGQVKTLAIVTPPLYGTAVVASASEFRYTPPPAWAGEDGFTYTVGDGRAVSAPAACRIQVRDPAQRASNLVVLAVNALVAPNIAREVSRLQADLENEGYTTRVTNWPSGGTSASNLWAYLNGEYRRTNQWLAGALLIGSLPKPRVGSGGSFFYTDLVYWNMKQFQTNNGVSSRHIWVSRLNVDSTAYGSEVTLLRRALDANHDYRTGVSRLPHTAYCYINREWSNTWDYGNGPTNLLQVWPAVQARQNSGFLNRPDISEAGADAFAAGGEVFDETSHGSSSGYMSGAAWFTTDDLYRLIAQVRAAFITSCSSGAFGGIANNQLYTRGGGNVLSVAATETTYVGCYEIADASDAPFRRRLAAGDSWGGAMLGCLPISDLYRTVFYGDLSLGVMPAPSNAMPAVTALNASCVRGSAPLTVDFSAAAADPDGALATLEWFCAGYNGGRAQPTQAGAASNVTWTYATTGTVVVRVEAVDAYRARAWKELTVVVDDCSPKANAGEDRCAEVGATVTLDGRASTDPQGDPLTYAWTQVSNGAPRVTLGNGQQAVATWVAGSTNTYRFCLTVSDGTNRHADEVQSVVVPVDHEPPAVVAVTAEGACAVTVLFSEPVAGGMAAGGAEQPDRYTINLGVTVTGSVLSADGRRLTLGTTPLAGGLDYVLTLHGIQDRACSPNLLPPGTQVAFRVPGLLVVDADEDGLPDAWEDWYLGGTNAEAGADADGDGGSNAAEYGCGTDPTNAASALIVSNLAVSVTGGTVLSWPSVIGRLYTVSKATDLVAGFTFVVDSNIAAQPPLNTYTDAADPAPTTYYRITAE